MKNLSWLVALSISCCALAVDSTSIEGTWLTGNGEGLITITVTDDGPQGSIAGSAKPESEQEPNRKDALNPDPALRDRPLLGLGILGSFKADGSGRWKGGRIYDPDSGKTYKCKLKLVDANTLEVRGYLGISLLGRTETWTRHHMTMN